MALSLLGCFTLLGGFFELTVPDGQTALILTTLLLSAPTVYYAVEHLLLFTNHRLTHTKFLT
jgi:hypothetical protein